MKRTILSVAALALLVFGWAWVTQVHADNDTTALQGKAAPDITLKTTDGKEVKLSDLKGHAVVLDFWATWCGPCLESLPHLEKDFQNKALADKGLKIYAVNCQEAADGVAAFIKKNNFTFNVALDPDQAVEKAYLVSGIPATVIIGKDGTIEHVVVGYNEAAAKEIDDAVNAALAK